MIGFVRLFDALRELQMAREELARQAVTEERLRMARDLHDLLGHTLSLIALKSELAGRLIERDATRAANEIQAVEREACQALKEVREAVAGYRQPSLQAELAGAQEILGAAGVDCSISNTTDAMLPGLDQGLAWVVREGVTNDGYPVPEGAADRPGSGLSGLAERVARLGGNMQAGALSGEGKRKFQLRVELPVRKVGVREEG